MNSEKERQKRKDNLVQIISEDWDYCCNEFDAVAVFLDWLRQRYSEEQLLEHAKAVHEKLGELHIIEEEDYREYIAASEAGVKRSMRSKKANQTRKQAAQAEAGQ
jgi:GrpB-like predicted nucleotidyltransferase (UPF0157 family)